MVREACHVIWTEGQVGRVADFYSEDFTADYPMADWGEGLQGVAALAASVRETLPGYGEEIEELIEAGGEVAVRLKISGTNPATGETVSFRDMTFLTIRDGKICFQRGLTDYMSLFVQMGLVDMPGG